MKNYKRIFQAFTLVTIVWFSSMGCVTKNLWRNGVMSEHYSEKIISFYANKQSQKLIFIGEKFHYVFNKNTNEFINFLDNRVFLNIRQKDLSITTSVSFDDDNRVLTYIYVELKKDRLNSKQVAYLISQNFIKPFHSQQGEELLYYSKNYTIVGKRYLANSTVNNKALKLLSPIHLDIETFRKEKNISLYKVLMTPLAVTADAGLALAGAVVLPIMWLSK